MVATVCVIASGLQDGLHLPISRPKTKILANSLAVRRTIAKGLRARGLDFEQAAHAEHLGVDFASGRRLVRNQLHARLKFVRQRQGKWATLRRGGGSTKRLAVTGASPALLYGTRVVGANDAEFHAIRREVATAAGNTGGGKSMLMGFPLDRSAVVNSDPAFRLTTGPVVEWSTALWSGEVPLDVLDRVARKAPSRLAGRRRPWSGAHGPGGVLLLTLRRMGWRLFDARTLEDDRGSRVDLLRVGPREVRCMVERGVSRWQHRMAGG